MAITIVKKRPAPDAVTTAQPLVEKVLSARQKENLDSVGLGDEPIQKTATICEFVKGAKIRIAHSLWQWLKDYRMGDTGTILKTWAPVLEAKGDMKYRIYLIKLDHPRSESRTEALLHQWEIEPVGE